MPISKPDHVQVQRLEFGKSVSTKLEKIIQQQERNIWLDAIPSIGIGAIGVGALFAGYGILSWAGMKLEDIVGDTKEQLKTWVNNASDTLVSAVSSDITLKINPETGEVEAEGGVFYVERRNAIIESDTKYLRPIQVEIMQNEPILCSDQSQHYNRVQCESNRVLAQALQEIMDSQFWEVSQHITFEIMSPSKTNFSSHHISATIRGRKINYVNPNYIRSIDPSY